MALSDLELLQLAEQVKEKQRGPKGEPGVGIQSIEQFDGDSFTIKLTDGNFKKIDLPAGKDGEAGPQGIPGPSVTGPEGRRGPAGADAAPARDGRDGAPGVSVDTAVVNRDGELLIGLSDGSSINVGRVVGPAGEKGDRGGSGLPGQPGSDGAAVLSGPRVPTQDDGQEGDHWIDVSTAEFGFYKKSGSGWSMLANLRQPGKNPALAVPVGTGTGTGGSGGRLTTATLPLDNPNPKLKSQKDLNEYLYDEIQNAGGDGVNVEVGDTAPDGTLGALWFNNNAEELTLYIYDGNDWIPAAPPVSLDGIEQDVQFISEVTGQLNRQVGALGRVTHDQENRITELENAPPISSDPEPDPRLPYRLGTDKAARAGALSIELVDAEDKAARAGAPSIELVDAEDNYSNVHIVGINGIKTESTITGINIDGSRLLTSEDANKNYLRDGFMSRKTCIFRRGGTSDDAFKITNESGGATVWRIKNEGGKDSPTIYRTDGGSWHQFAVEDKTIAEFTADGGTYTGSISKETSMVNKGYVDSLVKPALFVQRATQFKSGQTWGLGKVCLYAISGDLREWPDLISLQIAVDPNLEGLAQLPEEYTPLNNAYLKIYTHDMRLIVFHAVEKVRRVFNETPQIDVSVGDIIGDTPASDRTVDATPYIYELTGVLFN